MKKQNLCKNFILTGVAIFLTILPVYALELDMSVDEEIKKKYDTSKLEDTVLPPLPKVNSTGLQNQNKNQIQKTSSASTVPKETPTYTTTVPTISKVDKSNGIKLPNRTKFQTKSNVKISEWLAKGSTVSFSSVAPVYKRYITIPSGTIIKGVVADTHHPQISGNGGQIEIKITSIVYNGKSIPVNGKITKANSKKIFFNNIKGEHQYWKGVGKQIDKGENFYKKTRKTSSKLANNPLGVIISPIPTIIGWGGYAVCTIVSPITGFFSKGGTISIPSGSSFELKLLEDAYVY